MDSDAAAETVYNEGRRPRPSSGAESNFNSVDTRREGRRNSFRMFRFNAHHMHISLSMENKTYKYLWKPEVINHSLFSIVAAPNTSPVVEEMRDT